MSHDEKQSNFRNALIIESPDGIPFHPTQGNKWKFNRAVQRSTGLYSKLQKQLMTILIDSTNEGYGDDRSKWGYAYPSYLTLATECGCTPEAAKKNILKLEEKGVLSVLRAAGQRASGKKGRGGGGGRNKHNRYFLRGWNEIGRVRNGEQETVVVDHCMEKTVNAKRETVNGEYGNGNRRSANGEPGSPDSPLLTPYTHLKDTHTHFAPLSGAGSLCDEADGDHISTSDCLSPRQQFALLKHQYKIMVGHPPSEDPVFDGDEGDQVEVDGNWVAFREALGRVGFELMAVNISLAPWETNGDRRPTPHSFADCVSGKVWMPERGYSEPCDLDMPF